MYNKYVLIGAYLIRWLESAHRQGERDIYEGVKYSILKYPRSINKFLGTKIANTHIKKL